MLQPPALSPEGQRVLAAAYHRVDGPLGDDDHTENEAITTLTALARPHGAESRSAEVVAEKALRGRFRYAPALGWLEWDGRRWDSDDVAEPRVVEVVRQFIDATERDHRFRAVAGDPDVQEQADIWLNLLSAGRISSITKLCRGMDGIVTRSTSFDAHPDLLNCHNCVVDLRSGEQLPHDPDLLMTHLAGGDYIPDARSVLWDKALNSVHIDVVEWFQTRMGQSATGHTPDDDSMVVSDGGGENGKSAVMLAITRALGTYARLVSHRVLIAQPGQHPTELMDLRGLRLALLEETPEEGRLDTHQLKTTIGTPQITARRMRRDDVTFSTSHSLWVNTNFLPQVDSTDHGTWRRLKAMPWPYRFLKPGQPTQLNTDRAGDPTLKPKLATNPTVPAAVLAWIVEGAKRWYDAERVSPPDPKPVADATATWRANSDVGYQFAVERLTADPDSFITAEVMRSQFVGFLTSQGKREWSAQTINNRLPDSLLAAGINVSKTPVVTTKVRASDSQSLPPDDSSPWRSTRPPDIGLGKVVRMWRGVRFKTDTERAACHLTAV